MMQVSFLICFLVTCSFALYRTSFVFVFFPLPPLPMALEGKEAKSFIASFAYGLASLPCLSCFP